MNVDQALELAWNHKDMQHHCEPPGIGEALCIMEDALAAVNFNWITGQLAVAELQEAFAKDHLGQVAAIHAVKSWERKISLFRRAFPKASFKRFWDEYGNIDRHEQRIARSLFARKP